MRKRKNVEIVLRLCAIAVLFFGIVLVGAGDRMAAVSLEPPDDETAPAADSVETPPDSDANPTPLTDSAPQTVNTPLTPEAKLIGTALVEGGFSSTVFEAPGGPRLVWEGGEIAPGVRLLQVRRGWITIERDGIRQDIRLGSQSATARGEVANGPPEELSGDVERLLELRAQKFQALLDLRSRQLQ